MWVIIIIIIFVHNGSLDKTRCQTAPGYMYAV